MKFYVTVLMMICLVSDAHSSFEVTAHYSKIKGQIRDIINLDLQCRLDALVQDARDISPHSFARYAPWTCDYYEMKMRAINHGKLTLLPETHDKILNCFIDFDHPDYKQAEDVWMGIVFSLQLCKTSEDTVRSKLQQWYFDKNVH